MKRLIAIAAGLTALAAIVLTTATGPPARAATLNLSLQSYATGLDQPIDIANSTIPGDDRLFVAQRGGIIRVVQADGNLAPGNFLNIASLVNSTDGERGLLSLAFHPNYATNGQFFVFYTETGGDLVVARYLVTGDPTTSNSADPATALIIMNPIEHSSQSNHNGGDVIFGPDSPGDPSDPYLFWTTGDGGAGNDPPNNAQNVNSLLGKLLRLDINNPCCGLNYRNPPSNPFVGPANGADEVYDYGLRNPFRMSLDRQTKALYIGDVGQSAREEIDVHPQGVGAPLNFGWRCFEGTIPNPTPSVQCALPNHLPPSAEYFQDSPKAVTGGFVYRGTAQPALAGHYVFADFYTGDFWTLRAVGGSWEFIKQTTFSGRNLVAFGENVTGEVFAADIGNGTIYRIATPYSSDWTGQSAYPTIGSGDEATVHIDYKNTGSTTWTTGGPNPVRLATTAPDERASGAYNSSWISPQRPTTITGQVNGGVLDGADTSIEPNQVARFQFKVVGQPVGSTKLFRERFRPVAEGVTFMQDQGVAIDITNTAKTYGFAWAGQTYPPAVVDSGQTVNNLRFDLTNTGTANWRRDTLFPTRIGTTRPRDRASGFNNGWTSASRLPAYAGRLEGGGSVTNTDVIAPGETARFSYNIQASGAGLKREYFEPVVELFSWLGDIGIHWETYIKNPAAPTYDYQYVGQSPYPTIPRFGTATLKLQARNTGTVTWASNGANALKLGTEHLRDRPSGFSNNGTATGWLSTSRVKLTRNLTDPAKDVGGETTVTEGEVGEFEFTVKADPPPGPYPEFFAPVAEGITWLRDIGLFWRITVQ